MITYSLGRIIWSSGADYWQIDTLSNGHCPADVDNMPGPGGVT